MPPRRRPYPYDVVWGGTGLMLGRKAKDDTGPLVITKPQTSDQQQPSEPGFDAVATPILKNHVWDDLSLGFGQRIQVIQHERRYRYTIGADLSIAGLWQKGPKITLSIPATRDTVNGVTGFADLGGVTYAMNGRYMQVRSAADTWSVSKDFGVGKAAIDCMEFFSNASAGVLDSIYVAMGDAEPWWKYDAINGWIQRSGTGAGAGATYTGAVPIYVRAFEKSATWFYIANNNNHLTWCDYDNDPWNEANWIGPNPNGNNTPTGYTIGPASQPINRLVVNAQSALMVLKPDGIYSLDSLNIDHNLFPFLDLAVDALGGVAHTQWLQNIYVSYRDGMFSIDPNYTIRPMGPNLISSNDSPVRGRITALEGHDDFNLYAALYNEDIGAAYLMKYGSWLSLRDPPDWIAPVSTTDQRVDAWHGSISPEYGGKKITALHRSAVGAPSGHTRMYLGFSDGTIGWFTLPCTINPVGCDDYLYGSDDGVVYLPSFHGMFQTEPKALNAITVAGVVLDTNDYVQVQYRNDQTVAPFAQVSIGQTYGTYTNLTHFYYDYTDFPSLTGVSYLKLIDQLPVTPGYLTNEFTSLGSLGGPDYSRYSNWAQNSYYQLNGQTYDILSSVPLGVVDFNQSPRQIVEFPTGTGGVLFDLAVVLKTTPSGTSPVLTGVALNYAVRPMIRYTYVFRVLADQFIAKRDGTRLRLGAEGIKALIRNALESSSTVDVILPDETTVTIGVHDYKETMAWDERYRQWSAAIEVVGSQYNISGGPQGFVYGTYTRMTSYQYQQLAHYVYGLIPQI